MYMYEYLWMISTSNSMLSLGYLEQLFRQLIYKLSSLVRYHNFRCSKSTNRLKLQQNMNYEAHSQFQLTEYINLATPDADLSGSATASAHFEK